MPESYDSVTAEQLKDCTIRVSQQKEKIAISEIYSVELKFTST